MAITNSDMMNVILSHACPAKIVDEAEGIREHIIEVHCALISVTAKLLGWNDEKDHAEYEILEWSFVGE